MEWDLFEASEYIRNNTIDNEDFIGSDDARKTALLNVALRELERKYKGYIIPINAIYLYATAIATAYNSINKYQQQGVASFSFEGITYTFKDWAKQGMDALITRDITDLIGVENGIRLTGSGIRVARSVR